MAVAARVDSDSPSPYGREDEEVAIEDDTASIESDPRIKGPRPPPTGPTAPIPPRGPPPKRTGPSGATAAARPPRGPPPGAPPGQSKAPSDSLAPHERPSSMPPRGARRGRSGTGGAARRSRAASATSSVETGEPAIPSFAPRYRTRTDQCFAECRVWFVGTCGNGGALLWTLTILALVAGGLNVWLAVEGGRVLVEADKACDAQGLGSAASWAVASGAVGAVAWWSSLLVVPWALAGVRWCRTFLGVVGLCKVAVGLWGAVLTMVGMERGRYGGKNGGFTAPVGMEWEEDAEDSDCPGWLQSALFGFCWFFIAYTLVIVIGGFVWDRVTRMTRTTTSADYACCECRCFAGDACNIFRHTHTRSVRLCGCCDCHYWSEEGERNRNNIPPEWADAVRAEMYQKRHRKFKPMGKPVPRSRPPSGPPPTASDPALAAAQRAAQAAATPQNTPNDIQRDEDIVFQDTDSDN